MLRALRVACKCTRCAWDTTACTCTCTPACPLSVCSRMSAVPPLSDVRAVARSSAFAMIEFVDRSKTPQDLHLQLRYLEVLKVFVLSIVCKIYKVLELLH